MCHTHFHKQGGPGITIKMLVILFDAKTSESDLAGSDKTVSKLS
jgi:hypothetical protein